MDEIEALKRKVRLMESVFANLDTKAVSEELNRVSKNKIRVLNLLNLLNQISETKIDNTIYQEYIEFAKQIKGKMYEEKKRAIAGESSNIDDTEVTPIDCFSYKIIDGNNVEITKFYGNKTGKCIKIPYYVNDIQVTYVERIPFVKIPNLINGLLVTSIGYECFAGANIGQLVLPSGIAKIGRLAFDNAHIGYLKLNTGLDTIPTHRFYGCNIGCMLLGANIKVIENEAFYNSQIKMIRIPLSVKSIKNQAFFTRCNVIHILFEDCDNVNTLPKLENAFPPNALLYTSNIRFYNKLKDYKKSNHKYWDISDNVDEFELEWAIHTKSRDVKH